MRLSWWRTWHRRASCDCLDEDVWTFLLGSSRGVRYAECSNGNISSAWKCHDRQMPDPKLVGDAKKWKFAFCSEFTELYTVRELH